MEFLFISYMYTYVSLAPCSLCFYVCYRASRIFTSSLFHILALIPCNFPSFISSVGFLEFVPLHNIIEHLETCIESDLCNLSLHAMNPFFCFLTFLPDVGFLSIVWLRGSGSVSVCGGRKASWPQLHSICKDLDFSGEGESPLSLAACRAVEWEWGGGGSD